MNFMEYARSTGKLPDRYWYQLNGKTAYENFAEQRSNIYANQEDEELVFVLNSEVKLK